jgi:hypothetical protein
MAQGLTDQKQPHAKPQRTQNSRKEKRSHAKPQRSAEAAKKSISRKKPLMFFAFFALLCGFA